ncbi:type II secretion system protein GspF [Gammaproteobacteria bacterium SCGC AG-212-F23]|nr:type II secretion system protein GspF [Gammaproteobacteria bacterium SCGC AG-212-F23]
MAAFQYVAVDSVGKKQSGVIEAESEKHARQLLRNKHLLPLELRGAAQQKLFSTNKKIFNRASVSKKELALITRQFSTLLSAGLPIEEMLATVAEQSEKQSTKSIILSVRGKVLEGHSLAAAMREFPQAFSPLYTSTVAAGEKSGHLDAVLNRLADYTEQQSQMRQKILQALIYPSLMVMVSIGIVIFLLEYVVPKMVAVYSSTKQTLPMMTEILISMSQFLQNYGLYLLLILIIAIYFFRRTLKSDAIFRKKFHAFLLRLPVLGNSIKTVNTARFSRTFSILSAAGVPVLEAMKISSELITNIPIHDAVVESVNRVREGANIHLALKQTTYFSPMSIHLIASGEASGQLENMLERAAINQDNEITRLIETALALFEPAIILLMGSIVLFIVLAVLLPIFQLDQFVG